MKVVLDTNVLMSGIFFSGPPSEILKAWHKGQVQFVLTPDITSEYIRVAKILAVEYAGVDIDSILTLIITHSEVIQAPQLANQVCEDPDDDKFLACALGGDIKTIITGDKHLLKLSGYSGISIMTPRIFVETLLNARLATAYEKKYEE